jgi:hypothetical protein
VIDLSRPSPEPRRPLATSADVRAAQPALDGAIGPWLDRVGRAGALPLHRGRVNRDAVVRAREMGFRVGLFVSDRALLAAVRAFNAALPAAILQERRENTGTCTPPSPSSFGRDGPRAR